MMAFVAVGFLVATGVGVPLLVRTLSRGLGRRQLSLRAELDARIVDDIQGVQDVLAFGREEPGAVEVSALERQARPGAGPDGPGDRAANALGDLMTGLALVAILIFAVPLVAAGEMRRCLSGVPRARSARQLRGRSASRRRIPGPRPLRRTPANALFEITDSEPLGRGPA